MRFFRIPAFVTTEQSLYGFLYNLHKHVFVSIKISYLNTVCFIRIDSFDCTSPSCFLRNSKASALFTEALKSQIFYRLNAFLEIKSTILRQCAPALLRLKRQYVGAASRGDAYRAPVFARLFSEHALTGGIDLFRCRASTRRFVQRSFRGTY